MPLCWNKSYSTTSLLTRSVCVCVWVCVCVCVEGGWVGGVVVLGVFLWVWVGG